MKANIKKSVKSCDEIILSIGMIVKNEEKVLRRCLESLKPLMEVVKSELIIADTGSTDSTVEIAKEYTDNVFHFEWINDFAAARNATLKRAKGQWYFFVDADEYLDEDISEIVKFFSIPKLRSKYRTVEILIRNYDDNEKKSFLDARLPRFNRIDDPGDPVEFVGTIHETIVERIPLGYFSTILHHTGYCYDNEEQKKNKKVRNLTIMREEYKKNPKDIRMLSHLIDGTSYIPEEREKYVKEALELIEHDRFSHYSNVLYMQAVSFYASFDHDKALEVCKKYFEAPDRDKYIVSLAIYELKARIYYGKSEYENAIEEFDNYFRLYQRYENDEINTEDITAHPVTGLTSTEFCKNTVLAAMCCRETKNYKRAFEFLNKNHLEKTDEETLKILLGIAKEISVAMNEYADILELYKKSETFSDKSFKEFLFYTLESIYYMLDDNEREKFVSSVAESDINDDYQELMVLVINQNYESFNDRLVEYINKITLWTDGYTEAIYLALKHGVDLSNAILNMKIKNVYSGFISIAKVHKDFAESVLNYGIRKEFFEDIKKFNWLTLLYDTAVNNCSMLDDEQKYVLYSNYISLICDYVSNIYNPELLNDSDVEILPPVHQFGYFMGKASLALSEGDRIGYVRGMKHALQHCEDKREIISFMLEQFKKTL